MTRLNYLNDTGTPSPRGNLATAVRDHGAYGNQNFGYFVGSNPSPVLSITQRIDYATDNATASPKGPLSAPRRAILNAGFGTQNFGYMNGGVSPGPRDTIDRLDYSNDTATALDRANNLYGQWNRAATGNANFGYSAGGYSHGSSVERLDYANDTQNTLLRCFLSQAISHATGLGDLDFGYIAGGDRPSPQGGQKSSFERIDYANDTANTTLRGNRGLNPSAIDGNVSIGARSFGFTAILGPSVVSNAAAVAGSFNPTEFGYFVHGASPYPHTVTVDRIDYTNDTVDASPKGSLESGVRADESGSVGNSFFGYVVGGYRNTESRISRIQYINDTATAVVSGFISAARNDVYPVGNKNFGYFAGGNTSSNYLSRVSTVDRVDYSNDTGTTPTKGPLSAAKYRGGAAGNQNFGYICGGITDGSAMSTVDRIDYSNDTADASPKGDLSIARISNAATGNANFGYVGGGASGYSGPHHSSIDRIDYSNDTATASPKGPLSRNKFRHGATGNSSFGYFAGGNPGNGTLRSEIDRINYSNDTVTATPKGPLTSAKDLLSGVSAAENANPQ